jgi:hypothetical protein
MVFQFGLRQFLLLIFVHVWNSISSSWRIGWSWVRLKSWHNRGHRRFIIVKRIAWSNYLFISSEVTFLGVSIFEYIFPEPLISWILRILKDVWDLLQHQVFAWLLVRLALVLVTLGALVKGDVSLTFVWRLINIGLIHTSVPMSILSGELILLRWQSLIVLKKIFIIS